MKFIFIFTQVIESVVQNIHSIHNTMNPLDLCSLVIMLIYKTTKNNE